MRLLLDTHVLLWALSAPKRLGKQARVAIEDPDNEVMFSAASIWEIAIKSVLRKDDFVVTPDEILANIQIFEALVTSARTGEPVHLS